MQVVKGNDNKGKDVESYFEQLRKKEHATETHLSDLNEEGPSRIFTGRARTLGVRILKKTPMQMNLNSSRAGC